MGNQEKKILGGVKKTVVQAMKLLLKKIFPITFLKKMFVVYNTIKAHTVDKIFFPRAVLRDSEFHEHQKRNPFLYLGVPVDHFPSEVLNKLRIWCDESWTQDQYLLYFNRRSFLEPKVGWAMTMDRQLIYPSLGFASASHVHKPSFLETYFKKKEVVHFDKIISLRDTGEENYFHFFNDVLAKLFFLKDNHVELTDYTIIISEGLHRKPYFQYFLANSFLSELRWYIQSKQWVNFDQAIFCKPYTHTRRYFEQAVSLAIPVSQSTIERRIFLTRSKHSLRFIENMNEVEPILKDNGFDVVDTAELSFVQQVKLFSECRYLVAIHGAGITNMIFRGNKPMALLEIVHPAPYVPFHYIMLSKMFDFNYYLLLGENGRTSGAGGFRLSPTKLKTKLSEIINAE